MPSQKFIDLYRTETYHKFGNINPHTGEASAPIITLLMEPEFEKPEEKLAIDYKLMFIKSVVSMVNRAVKPAFTLSSGLDSSAILFTADNIFDQQNHAFSVVYDGSEYDESEDIKEMLGDTLRRWHPVRISKPDVKSVLREMINLWGEPIPTITWMSHYLLCKEVTKLGFGSLFHGIGSDEINAGEYEQFPYFLADLKDPAKDIQNWINSHGTKKYPKTAETAFELIDKIKRENLGGPLKGHLKNKLYRGLNQETLPCCLKAIEKNTQAFGLESYAPFLDKDLIQFMFRVPNHMKIRNGVMKWLHREAMKGLLPERTRTRIRKTGWNAPIDQWLPETKGMTDKEKMLYWQKLNLEVWLNE